MEGDASGTSRADKSGWLVSGAQPGMYKKGRSQLAGLFHHWSFSKKNQIALRSAEQSKDEEAEEVEKRQWQQ